MTNGTAKRNIYIFGGGMAGLAAAVRSHHLGCHPILLEATGHAGGRCRSLHDDRLEQTIDNGTHLILGGNRGIFSYLDDIGASGSLTPMAGARFPFVDLKSGLKWTVRPSAGKLPWWLLVPGRRVPGGKVSDYLALARLARASGDGALTDYIKSGTPMFERFWQPLARAVLNTEAEEASAALLGAMISETLLKGGEASRPYLASAGLSAALVDPGARFLDHIGAPVQFSQRIKSINAEGGWVKSFTTEGGETTLQGGDAVICALPPVEAQRLMPDLTTPTRFNAIVNAHFRMEGPNSIPSGDGFLGVIGSDVHWIFVHGDMISVTVSAANELAEESAPRIAERLWPDTARALGLSGAPMPPFRIIKEKRATMVQSAAENALRPAAGTPLKNLFLAGDWTNTGLPATIEGAVRSGRHAAERAA